MRLMKLLFVSFLFVIGVQYAVNTNSIVFADDDDDEKYEYYNGQGEENGEYRGERDEEEGPFEEVGKLLGWGTVGAIGAAGVFFPIRKSMKWTLAKFPDAKGFILSLAKFLGKYHVYIGLLALGLGMVHGTAMIISKGELETEGFIGLASVLVMIVAALFGSLLIKNKKAKTTRTVHITLLGISILIAAFHILAS